MDKPSRKKGVPIRFWPIRRISRGRPRFANTQRAKILRLLREAGTDGLSRADLIFNNRFTQCGARVDELKRQGFEIVSEPRKGEKFVRYVLRREPRNGPAAKVQNVEPNPSEKK